MNELPQRLDETPVEVDQERRLEIVDQLFFVLPVRFESEERRLRQIAVNFDPGGQD